VWGGSVGMTAFVLKLGSRWRWVVIYTLRPRYYREVRPDTLGGPQRQFWSFGKDCCVTLTFLSLVFLSAFFLCLFFLPVFHILFPPVFPVFVYSFYLIHFLLLSLLPHFLPKFISTPFHILPWRSRLFILHLVTRTVWNNSALALVLGRSFRLEIHAKTIPECDVVVWRPHCEAPWPHGLGWRGKSVMEDHCRRILSPSPSCTGSLGTRQ
jgi:hypothetical protein